MTLGHEYPMETISPAGEQPPPAQSDVVVRSATRAPQFCACPGFGAIFRSWALSTNNNTRINLRRVSMWLILLLRLAVSILLVLYAPFPTWCKLALRVFLGLGLTVGFFTQVWYIAMMDRAEGYRMLWRLKLGRKQLDIFLHTCAVSHVILFLASNPF